MIHVGFVLQRPRTLYDPHIAEHALAPLGRSHIVGHIVKLWLSAVVVGFTVLVQTAFSAEITPDGKVTFRIAAADAEKVELQGQWTKDRIALEKDKDQWRVTLDAVPAGVWEYNFVIDGIGVIDSSNPVLKPQRKPSRSILHVPGTPRIRGTGGSGGTV